MTASPQANRRLADYLRRRLDHLQQCNCEIENKFADDRRELCENINDNVYDRDDPGPGRMIHRLLYALPNTFRYTMLVGVCSFLEEAMKEITRRCVADYDERIKDARGRNWLRKHARVLSGSANLNTASLKDDFDKFYDMIALRNCIVHARGNLQRPAIQCRSKPRSDVLRQPKSRTTGAW